MCSMKALGVLGSEEAFVMCSSLSVPVKKDRHWVLNSLALVTGAAGTEGEIFSRWE